MKVSHKKIGILGSGSWGTVLADIAANNGNEVMIWSRNTSTADEINKSQYIYQI